MSTTTLSRMLSPRRVIPAAVAILVLALLLLPGSAPSGTGHPTTYDAGPEGARAVYDVLARLGFDVVRRTRSFNTDAPLDTATAYVILAPPEPLSAAERTRVLDAVRRGATVVTVLQDPELDDSLGFTPARGPERMTTLEAMRVAGPVPATTEATRAADQVPIIGSVTLWGRDVHDARARAGSQSFLWVAADDSTVPPPVLIGGRMVGRGHAVAIGSPTLVTNRVLRDPRVMIALVQALSWSGVHRVAFDEYHQGFGRHADVATAVATALTHTAPGRVALQGVIAALVLLLALAPRALPPRAHRVVSRRSPLEHVGALAAAYQQVDARRLAVARLVRGLRRRHPLGVPTTVGDADYLDVLARRVAGAAPAATLLRDALSEAAPAPEPAQTGAAIARLETALSSP